MDGNLLERSDHVGCVAVALGAGLIQLLLWESSRLESGDRALGIDPDLRSGLTS